MTDYMLTAHGNAGWRDIEVLDADDMHQAIRLAERASGCRVSHGRGHVAPGFDPAISVNAATGEVEHRHDNRARLVVEAGPPDVLRAISQALAPQKPKRSPRGQ